MMMTNRSPKSIVNVNNFAMQGESTSRVEFSYIQDKKCSCTNDEPGNTSISRARDKIFQLGALTGMICTTFMSVVPHDLNGAADESRPSPNDDPFWTEPSPEKQHMSKQLGE